MKKIAIPMANGDLSDRFEKYQYFLIYDLENPLDIKEDIKYPPSNGVEKLPAWFLSCGVSDIIARGIDYNIIKELNHNKIHVFVGVKKENPEDLISDYINRILDTNEQMCY